MKPTRVYQTAKIVAPVPVSLIHSMAADMGIKVSVVRRNYSYHNTPMLLNAIIKKGAK